MSGDISWLTVYGFGAHIKSTQKKLIILKKGIIEEYPLDEVKNLLVVGGHTLNSSTILQLTKHGAYITFFEPDGTPSGIIRPFGDREHEKIRSMQQGLPRHRYATILAQAAIKSRLLFIERLQEHRDSGLFYEGESQFIHKSMDELPYLITLDEIRRLSKLTTDMYYEIISRAVPPDFGFRRRTTRPHSDAINAMLSFGYAVLFGNCCAATIGSRLDPDIGLLHEGASGLVYDLIEVLKPGMIDSEIIKIANESLGPDDFELTPNRCILSDELVKQMTHAFHGTIDNKKIDEQVGLFYRALTGDGEFRAVY